MDAAINTLSKFPSMLAKAEARSLQHYIRSDYELRQVPVQVPVMTSPSIWTKLKTQIGWTNPQEPLQQHSYVNVLDTHPNDTSKKDTIVLMHGFGGGIPLWFANVDPLVNSGYRVIAMDWLGMGNSGRPEFTKFTPCHPQAPAVAESFFIDTFEQCRRQLDLTDFHLVGHSLGGYLACAYALNYPHSIKTLTLASPVGLPTAPMTSSLSENTGNPSLAIRMIQKAWSWNITPQSLVRVYGTKAITRLDEILQRRFGAKLGNGEENGSRFLAEYLYEAAVAPASGEYAINALLQVDTSTESPGIYAREALSKRWHTLAMPQLVLFGDRDWLFHPDIPQLCQANAQATLGIIPQAGHHLYLENPGAFHSVLTQFIQASSQIQPRASQNTFA